jgi:hypothetical protein
MWNRLNFLGFLAIALLLGTASSFAGELSNVTVGRSEDFTVVTLYGDGPMTVTHQIVEAKDGKPHRIVVDVTGALHRLPQNNFSDLPTGSISAIRTSQFAVSPDPVVRMVLDLVHPAAYRLETPGNEVRVMVSLPGDPPMASLWSARKGDSPDAQAAETAVLAAAESQPASPAHAAPLSAPESNTATSVTPVEMPASESQSIDNEPASPEGNPAGKTSAPEGEIQSLPPATAGALAVTDAGVSPAPEAAQNPASDQMPLASEQFAAGFSEPGVEDPNSPQVPLPEQSIEQPERVIDYNLPAPSSLGAMDPVATESLPEAAEPRLAVTTPPSEPEATGAEPQADAAAAPTGADAPVTDAGSPPVASLSTLPPLSEATDALVPQRTQVIYHTFGRRDPFKALLTAGGYNAAALPDVSSLRLVGVLVDVQENWGLFEDANGYGYILRKGDRVKNGTLTQLTNNRAYFSLTEFGWSRSVYIDLEPEG